MTAELTMNRVIHAAVRRDLARIEGGLRAMGDGDEARAAQLGRTWLNLQSQLVRHHEGEDDYIWPMLKGFEVDEVLLDAMVAEHEALSSALSRAAAAVSDVEGSATKSDAEAAAALVAEAAAVVDQHFAHEESEVEPLLAARFDTPEWKAVEKKLRGGSVVAAGWFFAWVQDGASAEELAYLRSVIPGPVLFLLGRVVGHGYRREVAAAWAAK